MLKSHNFGFGRNKNDYKSMNNECQSQKISQQNLQQYRGKSQNSANSQFATNFVFSANKNNPFPKNEDKNRSGGDTSIGRRKVYTSAQIERTNFRFGVDKADYSTSSSNFKWIQPLIQKFN